MLCAFILQPYFSFRSGSESGSDHGGRGGSQNQGELASKTLVLVRKMTGFPDRNTHVTPFFLGHEAFLLGC